MALKKKTARRWQHYLMRQHRDSISVNFRTSAGIRALSG